MYTPGVSERRGTATTFLQSGLKNADSQSGTFQTVGATRQYDAFGNLTASTGTWSGPFGYAGRFGYQEDATGLRLLGHRYYDPTTGRFLTRDPIKDGRNWYVYGAGEAAPTGMVDPSGLFTQALRDWIKGLIWREPEDKPILDSPDAGDWATQEGTKVVDHALLPTGAAAVAGVCQTGVEGTQTMAKMLYAAGASRMRYDLALEDAMSGGEGSDDYLTKSVFELWKENGGIQYYLKD